MKKTEMRSGCKGSWSEPSARTLALPLRHRLEPHPRPFQMSLAKSSFSIRGGGFQRPKSPNASGAHRDIAAAVEPC